MSTHQLVRYKQGKNNFELMVVPGTATKYRKGEIGLDAVLVSDVIFKNQSNGDRANAQDLVNSFGTENVQECIVTILQKGEIQLTAAERKEKVDKKKREIVNYVHKYYVDPKTKTPHPVMRIEAAMEELKFRVDGDVPAERQVQEFIRKLPDVLPIKKCEIIGQLSIPHAHMGSVGGVISQYVKITNERWNNEGCVMEVSLVPGDYDALLAELHRITRGDFTFDVEGAPAATGEPEPAPTRGRGGKRGGKTRGGKRN